MTETTNLPELTALEAKYCDDIREKDRQLRAFLNETPLAHAENPTAWFTYLTTIRDILGNASNSLSFVATLLAKDYLVARFNVLNFDAALKPQGAPGIDVEVVSPDGLRIVAEIKTTKPYQPGFGAAQKAAIQKDLERLAGCDADFRIMVVTDEQAFQTLSSSRYQNRFPNVEIVNAVTRHSSR